MHLFAKLSLQLQLQLQLKLSLLALIPFDPATSHPPTRLQEKFKYIIEIGQTNLAESHHLIPNPKDFNFDDLNFDDLNFDDLYFYDFIFYYFNFYYFNFE